MHYSKWFEDTRFLLNNTETGDLKRSFFDPQMPFFCLIGRLASEEVNLQLVRTKRMPNVCSVYKADIKSLDFAVTRFLMKLFRTINIDV